MREGELDQRPHLPIVETAAHGGHESGRNPVGVQVLESTLLDLAKVRPAQAHVRLSLEAVELQVYLEPGHVVGKTGGKLRLVGDSEAIGVDHEVTNRARLRLVEDAEEVRVNGRLAPRDLDYVRPALVLHNSIQHLDDVLEGAVVLMPLGSRGGVADGAAQVAVVGNLDQRQARVLLVAGT